MTSSIVAIVPSILDESTASWTVNADIRIVGFGIFCKYPINRDNDESPLIAFFKNVLEGIS